MQHLVAGATSGTKRQKRIAIIEKQKVIREKKRLALEPYQQPDSRYDNSSLFGEMFRPGGTEGPSVEPANHPKKQGETGTPIFR